MSRQADVTAKAPRSLLKSALERASREELLAACLELTRDLGRQEEENAALRNILAEDGFTLLLAQTCELCGRSFADGQELFLLTRARYRHEDGLGWAEPVKQITVCYLECAGVKVVRI